VARGFAGDIDHLSGIIKQGINHKGFSLIDILQPCVSYNHKNTFGWYKERVYKLDTEADYMRDERVEAFKKALEWGDRIPIGVIYEHDVPSFEQNYGISERGSLAGERIHPQRIAGLINEFT
jgi:2-oxoglutarate ferredoxin oxidoreductase subunit beta